MSLKIQLVNERMTESDWSDRPEEMHHWWGGTRVTWCLCTTKHLWAADSSPTASWRLWHVGYYMLWHSVVNQVW